MAANPNTFRGGNGLQPYLWQALVGGATDGLTGNALYEFILNRRVVWHLIARFPSQRYQLVKRAPNSRTGI